MTDVLIRPATPDDAAELARLGTETFLDTFVRGFGIPYPAGDLEPYLAESFGEAAVLRRIAEPGGAYWVAERDGALIGYANAGPNGLPHPEARDGELELRRLYIAGEAQGLGVGKRLLETALDWMEANSSGPLWIGVWSGNLRAQRLYAAYGFEKAGEYQYPVGSWRDDEFIMRRGR
jgi:ribosomal protein S18 acetylase RimI-like enzyme